LLKNYVFRGSLNRMPDTEYVQKKFFRQSKDLPK